MQKAFIQILTKTVLKLKLQKTLMMMKILIKKMKKKLKLTYTNIIKYKKLFLKDKYFWFKLLKKKGVIKEQLLHHISL